MICTREVLFNSCGQSRLLLTTFFTGHPRLMFGRFWDAVIDTGWHRLSELQSKRKRLALVRVAGYAEGR
jgi:hypothetical protein